MKNYLFTKIAAIIILLPFMYACTEEEPEPEDTTPPKIVSITPTNGASNVATDTEIKITMSEPLDITTIKTGNLILSEGFSFNLGWEFEMDGNSATIKPTQPLKEGKEYTIEFTSGVTDEAGNPLESFTSTFTTIPPPDTSKPYVVSISPADGETEVFPTDNIQIIFSETIDISKVTDATFSLKRIGSSKSEAGVLSMVGEKVTFNPDNELLLNSKYQIRLDKKITDLAGNPLDKDYLFEFYSLKSGCNDVEVYSNSNLGSDYPKIDAGVFTLIPDNLQYAATALFIEGDYQPPYTISFDYKIYDDGGVSGSYDLGTADGIVFFFQKNQQPYKNGTTVPSGNKRGFIDDGTGYGVAISPYGNRRIDYWYESPDNVLQSTATTLAYTGNTWVSARIHLFSDGFDLYLNGTKVMSDYTDLDLTHSKMGFGAATGGGDGLHMIKNIQVNSSSILCQ
ncbi:hypothetical protein E1176_18515 [Fulvivirga sp. RKSG066]|uniref:Ig-like domain-containing protein n=1 Tax=Fulvivirga aurantia TaxID=2529383 RepID=UPI0012BB63E5|nr:Ig-like domain-containing protein [Fulvivirga aurantia]MTI23031.1 hypothetical protein [Fulvivirga aurantia]